MTGSVRPRTASAAAVGIGVLALAAALSACGPSTATVNPGGPIVQNTVDPAPSTGAGPSSSASTVPSANGVPTSSPSAVPTRSVSVPVGTGAVNTPKQVLAAAPAGAKLVPFDGATTSTDGRTVYVELESMGGACGQYDVVLQQSSASVSIGLVHLPSSGHPCPQFVGPMRVAVPLAAPLSGRAVVDLADGQHLNVG